MKKILFLVVTLGLSSFSLFAGEFTGAAEYTGSSEFNQVKARALWQFNLNWSTGLEGKWAKEDAFEDPIYAVKMPISFNSDLVSFNLAPFYYFKNKSDKRELNAFGVASKLVLTLEDDSVNEMYSHVFLGASFARQQGVLVREGKGESDEYYSQAAYSLGFHKNFYRTFSFELMGTGFQYPDGITNVQSFRGILDQQDLAFLQSYDIVHALPKYTVGTRITRLWTERRATLYASYRFGEFYTADPEHSFVLGNTFALAEWMMCDLAYNHLRTVHNDNKRDIFYAQLKFVF